MLPAMDTKAPSRGIVERNPSARRPTRHGARSRFADAVAFFQTVIAAGTVAERTAPRAPRSIEDAELGTLSRRAQMRPL